MVRTPKMYQLWFGKEGSGYCGTGKWTKRSEKSAKSTCLNCGKPNKDATHVVKFPTKERRLMLLKSIQEIKEWMIDNHTYPELIE